MLSVPKSTLTADDKENDGRHETPRGKQGLQQTAKRNYSTIQTPLGNRSMTNTPVRHPILRDITNSALRVNDIFPSEKRNLAMTKSGSKPAIESKLRIANPESVPDPQTIEELLALPDDLLPEIEFVSAPIERDEFEGLPLLEDITNVQIAGSSQSWNDGCETILQSAAKSRKLFNITNALQELYIDPSDFDWAFERIESYEKHETYEPCYFSEEFPHKVQLV